MNNQPVLINGKNYDWADLQFVIFGIPLTGIKEISYMRKGDTVDNYGIGREPVSFGYKNIEYSGSITVQVDEIQNILQTAPGRSIIEIPPFSATVIAGASGTGVLPFTHKLKNIRFTEDNFDAKQNDSEIICKIPFKYAGLFK